jgi:DNA-binding transcriptional ArsR family regulator
LLPAFGIGKWPDMSPPPKFALPETRAALARMYVELTKAFHATIFPLDQKPSELDANLTAVVVTVMMGQAEGRPMTASEVASELNMPPRSVQRRLDVLVAHGIIQRIERKYYLDPVRAAKVPHRDHFEFILSKAFAVIGAHLSKTDA